MSEVATVIAALIAAPAAVYAAIHTRRAPDAGASAAAAAASQVQEMRALREPDVALTFRIPSQLTGENWIQYGRGDGLYRNGTPIHLDVWNVGGPTIMVMEVTVKVDGALN